MSDFRWCLTVACPTCGAAPRQLCGSKYGDNLQGTVHARRRRRYRQEKG
jgi:hypothetical protein